MISDVVAFWVLAIGAIVVLRMFPRARVTRLLFTPLGPVPRRGERRVRYRLRWALQNAIWLAQCAVLFALGAALRSRFAELDDSLAVVAFQVAVLPVAATLCAIGTLGALAGALRAWLADRGRRALRTRMGPLPAMAAPTTAQAIDPVAVDARDRG